MADQSIEYPEFASGEDINPATGKKRTQSQPLQYATPGTLSNAGAGMASLKPQPQPPEPQPPERQPQRPTAYAPGRQYYQQAGEYETSNDGGRNAGFDVGEPTPGQGVEMQPTSGDKLSVGGHWTYDNAEDAARAQAAQQQFDANRSAVFERVRARQAQGQIGASDEEKAQIDATFDPTRYGGRNAMPNAAQNQSGQPVDTSKFDTDGYAAPGYIPKNIGNAPSGYDATKWNDPNHQTPKYVVGRIMQEASGGTGKLSDPTQRQAAIDRIMQAYPGSKFDGKDKITFPDGGTVDVFGASGSGEYRIAWMPETGPGGAPLEQAGGGGGLPGGGTTAGQGLPVPGAGGGGGGFPQGGGGIRDPRWQGLYDELLKRSQQSLEVNPNDPVIKAQVDAATAIANREALKQQQAAAERGGPYATGALQNQQRMSNEAVQLQTGAMQAELMGREVAARRQEIAQALAGRQGLLTVEEQSRLREIDQQLQREQMSLADKHASFQDQLQREIAQQNFGQMAWERAFRDRGWESDLAQQNWQNERSLWG